MKYGIIDIGSNTMRLNLYTLAENGSPVSLLHKKTVAGLSTYIKDEQMTRKGVDKLVRILAGFLEVCAHFDIDKVHIFATAALRNAKNHQEILTFVDSKLGCEIDLISGIEEAELGYLGVKDDFDLKMGYLVDIGGGSAEISTIKNEKIIHSCSLPEGSLSLFKEYSSGLLPSKNELHKMRKHVRKLIQAADIPQFDKPYPLYGLGGTIRACGNIAQEAFDLSSNNVLYYSTLRKLQKGLQRQDKNLIRTTLQVVPERIHTLVPGFTILREIMRYTSAEQIYISCKGAREGYLLRSIADDRATTPNEERNKQQRDESGSASCL